MREVWKLVEECPHYEVSNKGRVRSMTYVDELGRHHDGKILRPSYQNYATVQMGHKGKMITRTVHRLVAKAFIPNPNNLEFVNHKDENKHNNNVDNLEWCTRQYNNEYGTARQRQARTKGRKVAQYTPDGKFVADYYSISKASRVTGFSIGAICKGLKCGVITNGYRWKDCKVVKVYA